MNNNCNNSSQNRQGHPSNMPSPPENNVPVPVPGVNSNFSSTHIQAPNQTATFQPTPNGISYGSFGIQNAPGATSMSQDQQRQLANQILTSALGSAYLDAAKALGGNNIAQLIMGRSQTAGQNSEGQNELQAQQLGFLQSLQQQQPNKISSTPAPNPNGYIQPQAGPAKIQKAVNGDQVPPPDQSNKAPSSSKEQDNGKSKALASSIVPCRARGMSPAHNSNTAYFVIPQDVKHGENLLCSDTACRNEGIKFCYCSFCGIPVAKRNFRQRHDHNVAQPEAKLTRISTKVPETTQRKVEPAVSTSAHKRGNDLNNESDDSSSGMDDAPMRSLVFNNKSNSNKAGGGRSSEERQKERQWAALLLARPRDSDSDEMSQWLMSILAVSSPNGDVDEPKAGPQQLATRKQLNSQPLPGGADTSSGSNSDNSTGPSGESAEAASASSEGSSSSSFGGNSSSSPKDWFSRQSQSLSHMDGSGPGPNDLTRPSLVSDYRPSESSNPTDGSGGVDTTSGTNESSEQATSATGSNGSSEEPSACGSEERSGSGNLRPGDSSGSSENGSNDLRSPLDKNSLKRHAASENQRAVKRRKESLHTSTDAAGCR